MLLYEYELTAKEPNSGGTGIGADPPHRPVTRGDYSPVLHP